MKKRAVAKEKILNATAPSVLLNQFAFKSAKLSEVLDCSYHLACVAVLVVIPGNYLYFIEIISNLAYHCLCSIEE